MKCATCERESQHTHHIISKSMGGKNTKANTIRVCAACHFDIHASKIVIEGNFLTTDGYQVIFHRAGEESITGSSPAVYTFN